MRNLFFSILLLLVTAGAGAQIQISKIIGKNSSDFKLGYGGFLKFSYPVSDAADITLEGGFNIFMLKNDPAYGWGVIPIKAGYRRYLNGTGEGLYAEPQLGYNVFGVDPDDNKSTGPVFAGGVGYVLPRTGFIQLDLGLLFESAYHKGGSANYLSLRLTHNFSLRRRESDY